MAVVSNANIDIDIEVVVVVVVVVEAVVVFVVGGIADKLGKMVCGHFVEYMVVECIVAAMFVKIAVVVTVTEIVVEKFTLNFVEMQDIC